VGTYRSLLTNRSCHRLAVCNCSNTGKVVDAWGLVCIRSGWILQQKFTSEEDRATSEYMVPTVENHGSWYSLVGPAA
jgi:hypothetical protein